MKKMIIIINMLFLSFINLFAASDSLNINLKNGKIENIDISKIKNLTFDNITSVEEFTNSKINLIGNFPNPAVQNTILIFDISEDGIVEIKITNSIGELIKTFTLNNCKIGNNNVYWDCKDCNGNFVVDGTYFFQIKFKNELQSKKICIIH